MFPKKLFSLFIAIMLSSYLSPAQIAQISPASAVEEYWDWKAIEKDPDYHKKLSFKNKHLKQDERFLWGVAISNWQNGPIPNDKSNWKKWEQGKGNIKTGESSQHSCNHWEYYQEDIKALDALDCDMLRFSFEWSAIEPILGEWDEKAIQHYHDEIDALLAAGKTPMATLHHFVHPQWFENLGAFEKEENILYFIRFADKVFQEFNGKVKLWCTINEPSVYASQGYIMSSFPPGEFLNLEKAGIVLKNLLQAHVMTYNYLKASPGGEQAQIGIVHQHLIFRPFHDGYHSQPINSPALYLHNLLNLPERAMADFFSLPSLATFQFLKTGRFDFTVNPYLNSLLSLIKSGRAPVENLTKKITQLFTLAQTASTKEFYQSFCPTGVSVKYTNPDNSKPPYDFLGLNYYSQILMKVPDDKPGHRPGDIVTDFWYAFYPEGLYHALKDMSTCGVPIYITENGVADNSEDGLRGSIWSKRYSYAVNKALENDIDVRAIIRWTLMDNFEWNEGYKPQFGLYRVSWQGKKRILQLTQGAQTLIEIIKGHKEHT